MIHYLQHRLGRKWAPVDIPNLFYWLIGVECRCGTVVRSFDEHMDHHREHSEAHRREWSEQWNQMLIRMGQPPIPYEAAPRDPVFEARLLAIRPLW